MHSSREGIVCRLGFTRRVTGGHWRQYILRAKGQLLGAFVSIEASMVPVGIIIVLGRVNFWVSKLLSKPP